MARSVIQNVEISILEMKNPTKIVQYLRKYFNHDEPTMRSKLQCRDFNDFDHDEVDKMKLKAITQNLSLTAIAANGDVAGLMINDWIYKDAKFDEFTFRHPQSRALAKLFHDASVRANLFNEYGVERIFEFKAMGIDPKYRGHRIGMKLFGASEELARKVGAKVSRSDCTSAYSSKIHDAFGWKVASEVYYKDYVNESGKVLIQCEPPHVKYQLRYKIFD